MNEKKEQCDDCKEYFAEDKLYLSRDGRHAMRCIDCSRRFADEQAIFWANEVRKF